MKKWNLTFIIFVFFGQFVFAEQNSRFPDQVLLQTILDVMKDSLPEWDFTFTDSSIIATQDSAIFYGNGYRRGSFDPFLSESKVSFEAYFEQGDDLEKTENTQRHNKLIMDRLTFLKDSCDRAQTDLYDWSDCRFELNRLASELQPEVIVSGNDLTISVSQIRTGIFQDTFYMPWSNPANFNEKDRDKFIRILQAWKF